MNREELLKNAKPILFNTEMVQAILEGRKTVTRRVLKKQPIYEKNSAYMGGGVYRFEHYGFDLSKDWTNISLAKSEGKNIPFEVGDIIYVRETWCYHKTGNWYGYRADGDYRDLDLRWKPSIHMPKVAARIFLKVTDVRAERLQDITVEQVEKEGIYAESPYTKEHFAYRPGMLIHFSKLWDNTIKKQNLDKYGWETNPWVWVIEFERVEVENE